MAVIGGPASERVDGEAPAATYGGKEWVRWPGSTVTVFSVGTSASACPSAAPTLRPENRRPLLLAGGLRIQAFLTFRLTDNGDDTEC